jgi:hypothetical protein
VTAASSPAPVTALERWAPLPPLVLVNIVAVYGQYGWAEANLPGITSGGLDVPLVGGPVRRRPGVHRHLPVVRGAQGADGGGLVGEAVGRRLRVAFLAGALNYWHLADPVTHQPTPAAVAFAAMSLLSPWLWGIRSRSMNRDRLRDLDLIEPRAVKFSAARWVLFPRATFAAFKAAVWAGETNPRAAVALLEQPAPAVTVHAQPVSEPVDEAPAPCRRRPGRGSCRRSSPTRATRRCSPPSTGAARADRALRRSGVAPSTLKNAVKRLEAAGHVEKVGTLYRRRVVA